VNSPLRRVRFCQSLGLAAAAEFAKSCGISGVSAHDVQVTHRTLAITKGQMLLDVMGFPFAIA
jgi:hypothetical protein